MKTVPLKDLKKNLAHLAQEAARGAQIAITRYNRPYITLGPAHSEGLHIGSKVGVKNLESVIRNGSNGQFLRVLLEDRE